MVDPDPLPGRRGGDDALDAIEQAYGADPATGLNRIEHATMARQDQIDRMKRLGVQPSFIPDFVYLYGAAYRDRIFGPERADFMVPRSLPRRRGCPLRSTPTSPPLACRSIPCDTCRRR